MKEIHKSLYKMAWCPKKVSIFILIEEMSCNVERVSVFNAFL